MKRSNATTKREEHLILYCCERGAAGNLAQFFHSRRTLARMHEAMSKTCAKLNLSADKKA